MVAGTTSRTTENQFYAQSEEGTSLTKSGTSALWDLKTLSRHFMTVDGDYQIKVLDAVAGSYFLHLRNDTTAGHKISWGTRFDNWADGVEPVLNDAPEAHNILEFYCNGTEMFGRLFYQTPIL